MRAVVESPRCRLDVGAAQNAVSSVRTVHLRQPYRTATATVVGRLVSLDVAVAQLATDGVGLLNPPAVVTHRAPLAVEEYFDSAAGAFSTIQTHFTITDS